MHFMGFEILEEVFPLKVDAFKPVVILASHLNKEITCLI